MPRKIPPRFNQNRAFDAGYVPAFSASFFWHPSFAPVRKLERFKAVVRKIDLVARRAGRNSAGPRQLTISSATDDNSYLSLCPFMAEAVEELFRRRSRANLIQRKRRPRNLDSRN